MLSEVRGFLEGLWGSCFAWHSEKGAVECSVAEFGDEGMVLSVPLSLSKPLHCFSPETLEPQALQELSIPRGAPLTAQQDTWTVVRRGCPRLRHEFLQE